MPYDQLPTVELSITDRVRSAENALTAQQVAALLNISPKTVFKLAKAGRMPAFRIGTSVRFCPKKLADYLDRQSLV